MSSKRLKHFCEMCRKQCKDENGFKCHLNSEAHQMRVRDFATNPLEHIQKASRQFQWRFIQLIKNKYPGQPRYLEELYNELMEEKKFLKFNHTQWKNLTDFGHYLKDVKNLQVIGQPPNCKILYLVNKTKDFMDATKKQKLQAQKERQKQQFQKSIQARIQKEREIAERKAADLNAQIAKQEEERKHMVIPDRLEFNIQGFNSDNKRSAFYTVEELQKNTKEEAPFYKKKLDNIQKLYEELKKKNEGDEQDDEIEWIKTGITIKIKPHQIDPAFHNKKCKILRIIEPFVAEVALGTAKIQIDQANLQTVIPKVGHKVMILHGQHKGEIGAMTQANISEGYGIVQVKLQKLKVPFNLISRFDDE